MYLGNSQAMRGGSLRLCVQTVRLRTDVVSKINFEFLNLFFARTFEVRCDSSKPARVWLPVPPETNLERDGGFGFTCSNPHVSESRPRLSPFGPRWL